MDVDNDRQLRSLVGDVLLDVGFGVVSATNGHHALRLLRHQPPDLLVTDLRMPVLDGWTLVKECRADPALRGLPIVVISAEPALDLPAVGALGVQGVVPKPFDLNLLVSTIRRLVPKPQPNPHAAQ